MGARSLFIDSRKLFLQRITGKNLLLSSFWLWLYSFVPSLLVSAFLYVIVYFLEPNLLKTIGTGAGQVNLDVPVTLIINPLLESLVVIVLLKGAEEITSNKLVAVVGTAVLLSALHSLSSPLWGISIFWMFYAHARSYVDSCKSGILLAYSRIALAHSLQNASVFTLISIVG